VTTGSVGVHGGAPRSVTSTLSGSWTFRRVDVPPVRRRNRALTAREALAPRPTPALRCALTRASLTSQLSFSLNGSRFNYGDFLNALIAFLVIAAAVYFFVILPVNRLMVRFKPSAEEPTPTKDCPYCLSSIPVAATRCAFCTADLGVVDVVAG